jgi:hypothetical protein
MTRLGVQHGVHVVSTLIEWRRRRPSAWQSALVAIELYWLALGRRHAEHIAESPTEALPFVFAVLGVIAAVGLVAAGRLGRVIAGVVAAGGAIYALAIVGFIVAMIVTAPDGISNPANAWGFLAIYLGIAAGYGLVVRRAIRGRAS